jgi:hypothetical protein
MIAAGPHAPGGTWTGTSSFEEPAMSDSWYKNRKRAVDDAQKDEIAQRLLAIWKASPSLRFMQLLGNAFRGDAYYVEDYAMIEVLEEYYKTPVKDPSDEEIRQRAEQMFEGGF